MKEGMMKLRLWGSRCEMMRRGIMMREGVVMVIMRLRCEMLLTIVIMEMAKRIVMKEEMMELGLWGSR